MGRLDRIIAGRTYQRLVLPEPRDSTAILVDRVRDFGSASNRSLFRELLPYYREMASDIERLGYGGIADLVRFCFDQVSEYFTRGITEKNDDETVRVNIGLELDMSTEAMVRKLIERSRVATLFEIAQIYQSLAPRKEITSADRQRIADELAEAIGSGSSDTRGIRRVLSRYATQTYSDAVLTLSLNYLNKVFNTDFQVLPQGSKGQEVLSDLSEFVLGLRNGNDPKVLQSTEKLAEAALLSRPH